jgi:hypothetical protein
MQVRFGERMLEVGGPFLAADLHESNDLLDDPSSLRERLEQEGYLLLRGLQDRKKVAAARLGILEKLAEDGAFDPGSPLLML